MSVFITGSFGFVGTSFLNYFKNEDIRVSSRAKESNIDGAKVIIHLAGNAHDLKKTTNPKEYNQVILN
jgi:nucleoside-diphosphate-sugar epimerase